MKICTICSEQKDSKGFYAAKENQDGLMNVCRLCHNARNRKWKRDHQKRASELSRKYRLKNHPAKLAYLRDYYIANKEKHRSQALTRHYQQKDAVFAAYGGYQCACCGEKEKAFLCIDHIENDGFKHRAIIRNTLYRWLVRNNFPSGFQVLCANCNNGKRVNKGICPHQQYGIKVRIIR